MPATLRYAALLLFVAGVLMGASAAALKEGEACTVGGADACAEGLECACAKTSAGACRAPTPLTQLRRAAAGVVALAKAAVAAPRRMAAEESCKCTKKAAATTTATTVHATKTTTGAPTAEFLDGVATFDPAHDRVIFWSKVTPKAGAAPPSTAKLTVASDAAMASVVKTVDIALTQEKDYVAIADVDGLAKNTQYYYKFEAGGATSMPGKTRTLPGPEDAVNSAKFAVVSCSNYQGGFFNVYDAIDKSDVHYVLHMGDYIYEYGAGGYASSPELDAAGRIHKPAKEVLTLAEYRERYSQYRRDPHLLKLHASRPFIAVWDDHELTNDAYDVGAQNHQPATEGDWTARRLIAAQVWHEFLPARLPAGRTSLEVYRSFKIGSLVNLVMLETRINKAKQLSLTDPKYYGLGPSGPVLDASKFMADYLDPERGTIGDKQLQWVASEVVADTRTWQFIGSSVLMGKIQLPLEMMGAIAALGSVNSSDMMALFTAVSEFQKVQAEMVQVKNRVDAGTATATDQARLANPLPYNFDSWDGYPIEREKLYAVLKGKNVITTAGDTHNAWMCKLHDAQGNLIGTEMATMSVSSPGFEGLFTDKSLRDGFISATTYLVDELEYLEGANRGFLTVEFTPSEVTGTWTTVDTVRSTDYKTEVVKTAKVQPN